MRLIATLAAHLLRERAAHHARHIAIVAARVGPIVVHRSGDAFLCVMFEEFMRYTFEAAPHIVHLALGAVH